MISLIKYSNQNFYEKHLGKLLPILKVHLVKNLVLVMERLSTIIFSRFLIYWDVFQDLWLLEIGLHLEITSFNSLDITETPLLNWFDLSFFIGNRKTEWCVIIANFGTLISQSSVALVMFLLNFQSGYWNLRHYFFEASDFDSRAFFFRT